VKPAATRAQQQYTVSDSQARPGDADCHGHVALTRLAIGDVDSVVTVLQCQSNKTNRLQNVSSHFMRFQTVLGFKWGRWAVAQGFCNQGSSPYIS